MKKLFGQSPKRWPRVNTQRERKLGKFDLFTRLLFVLRILLINLIDFRTTLKAHKRKKEAGMSDK